ncbi:MAG: helix-turn-helix domain-containing protein, partial [Oscillospiraceae bacterium]|nr:helix-turn-helix domain-containing protein [Oscillospiraceae bacterium]
MYFYQRLRDLREDRDMTQAEVAEVLGITRQQYQLYESGRREMPFNLIIDFGEYFNVSIDY